MASIYLPNGNPTATEKFAYKLRWLERLRAHAMGLLLDEDEPVVLGGDYNVIPEPRDVHNPEAWEGDALFRPESRRAFRGLLNLGLVDAVRALHPDEKSTPSGTTRRAPSSSTTASASTTCCSRPAPPTASRPPGSTRTRARRPKASDHTPVLVRLRDEV